MKHNGIMCRVAGIVFLVAGCGGPVEVEVVVPYMAPIQESFTEPARTRLAKTYPVTMPVSGRIGRIEFEPGDPVKKGQALAEFDRVSFERAVAEARAAIAELEAQIAVQDDDRVEKISITRASSTTEAAREALNVAEALVKSGSASLERAAKELDRVQKLATQSAVSKSDLDDARLAFETRQAELRQYEAAREEARARLKAVELGPQSIEQQLAHKRLGREVLLQQLEQAESRLVRAEHDLSLASVESSIDGVVLKRYEQGDSTMPAGKPLMLLGNMSELEVVAEVLTQDAMRLRQGSKVVMEPAAKSAKVMGKVTLIEPAGFTKYSSLGVEQQRVNAIVALEGSTDGLGVGYRLQARFITGSKDEALLVPRFSVLQAPDRSFYVLKINDGKIKTQPVRLGLQSDLEMEVIEGLTQDDTIVAVPDTTMDDGTKVTAVTPVSDGRGQSMKHT